MRKLASQLFKQVASDTAKKSLLPQEGPVRLQFMNGFGLYALPLVKLEFVFGLRSGDSTSLRKFLDRHLTKIAAQYPSVEFLVTPQNGKMAHIRGTYLSGPDKLYDAYNKTVEEVFEGLQSLIERSGERTSRFRSEVKSVMPAVRPIWSPFHGDRRNMLTRFVAQMRSNQQRRQTLLARAQQVQQGRLQESKQKLSLSK